jgi:hypothetical protein
LSLWRNSITAELIPFLLGQRVIRLSLPEKTPIVTFLILRQQGVEWIVKILKWPGDRQKKSSKSLGLWSQSSLLGVKRDTISQAGLITVQQKITSLINLQGLHCASFLSDHPLPTETFNQVESSPLLYRNLSDFLGGGKGT